MDSSGGSSAVQPVSHSLGTLESDYFTVSFVLKVRPHVENSLLKVAKKVNDTMV